MQRFKDYIGKLDRGPPLAGTAAMRAAGRKGTGHRSNLRSLDAASLLLPADTDADAGASLFKEFWDALVVFRHRDVLVVAMCPDRDE